MGEEHSEAGHVSLAYWQIIDSTSSFLHKQPDGSYKIKFVKKVFMQT